MDKEDELYIQQQIDEFEIKYLNEIKEDCRKLLHEALMETVFAYSPKVYNRTGQLEDINNIDFKIDNNSILIYFNTDNMEYYSFWKGKGYDTTDLKSVGADALIHFLEVGHDSYSPYEGDTNMFWHYPAQHFLELAQSKIQNKYPDIDVQVVRDQPNLY